ncbi:SpoIIE family protein phosphatase [bacterium]|nr:SpoIIE family protein phosphatase [bacterium]
MSATLPTPSQSRGSDDELRLEHRAIVEALRTIASTLDVETVLRRLLRLTNRMLGFEYCTILLIDDDTERMTVAARYGYPESIVQNIELAVGLGVTGRAAQTGRPVNVPDVSREERYLAGLKGARSELVVPLKTEGHVIGVFDVQSQKLDAFNDRDTELLQVLADIASVAISNARSHKAALHARDEESMRRALEREISLGRTFQERLLPEGDPMLTGHDVAGMNLPGRRLSGDYFDYITLPNGHLGIAVADVSGKGVPAALLAASLQATLRSHVENLYSIATIMERANNSFCRTTAPESFATLFYGVLDPAGALTYVNAGHNPPLILSSSGSVEYLTEGGTVLGMFSGIEYHEGRTSLAVGDYLVIYTDGLSEAERDGELFGEERIADVVRGLNGAPARVVASTLITEADSFSGGDVSPDDITVVVVRKLGA